MSTGSDVAPYGFETEAGKIFPRYVMYDVNNVCNARCPFCPQSAIAQAAGFVPQSLAWEDFETTIREVAQYPVELVRFTGDGEPLLHPRISDMLALCRDLGIAKVNLTTNGSLLRGRRLDAILKTPPQVLDVSLDAFTPATYAKYRVGLDFDVTVANVKEFLTRRDPRKTRVVLSIIAHDGMEDEIRDFTEYWKVRADEVAVRGLHTNLGAVAVAPSPRPRSRWPCPHLWQRLVVDFRGHIRFCPIDWHDKSFVGRVGEMTLYDAWHSPQVTSLRRRHLEGDYAGAGVCENCTDWASTHWGKSWLDMMTKSELDVE